MGKAVSKQESGRIVWLDIARLAAMFMVVCCHCTDPFNFRNYLFKACMIQNLFVYLHRNQIQDKDNELF